MHSSGWAKVLGSSIWNSLLVFATILLLTAARKDHSRPHPHQGILKTYQPGPFADVQLTKADEQKLADGQPVMKQSMPDKNDPVAGGGAICVQDVDAPKDAVWNQILDLDSYKGKVPKVLESRNYYIGETKDGARRIKTKMVLGVLPGYSVSLLCQR